MAQKQPQWSLMPQKSISQLGNFPRVYRLVYVDDLKHLAYLPIIELIGKESLILSKKNANGFRK